MSGQFTQAQHRAGHETLIDRYADLLADGHDNVAACRILNRKPSWGRVILSRIRGRLGWQAV